MTREPELPDRLPIPVVDDHTHLDIDRARWDEGGAIGLDEIGAALAAAAAVGVDRVVTIGCDLPSARFTVQIVEAFPAALGGVALHPNEAPRLAASGRFEQAFAEIEALAGHARIRTVGETGLDFFRTGPEGRGIQEESFRRHIDLAKRLGKPLQIHDRDAHDDVLRVLDAEGAPQQVVMHCFSGDAAFARACLERGFSLSFAGPITFKNNHSLRDAAAITPLDRLLVETDAPYLTPHPWRGATNSPALMPWTVRALAQVTGVSVAELCTAVSANAEALYGPW